MNENEKRVISKLAVFGGCGTGVTQEKLEGLMDMNSDNISSILNNLENQNITKERASDSEEIRLCEWVCRLLKDISKNKRDRELKIKETHMLNVVCVLKGESNLTQKELSKRAKVPTSSLSDTVLPKLEGLNLVTRVSFGTINLVRLANK